MTKIAFEHVQPGFPIGDFLASEFNAMLDAGQAHKLRAEPARRDIFPKGSHPFLTIDVANRTNQARQPRTVLAIRDPVITPTDDLDAFRFGSTMNGFSPSLADWGKFAVLAQGAGEDFIASGYIAGLCSAQVNVRHDQHDRADIKFGDVTQLESGFAGTAKILWKESGIGVKWARLLLGQWNQPTIKGVANQTIPFGGNGPITVWRQGAATTATEIVHLNWMHGDQDISEGSQLLATWFPDELKWIVIGAECEDTGTGTPPPVCDNTYSDSFDSNLDSSWNLTGDIQVANGRLRMLPTFVQPGINEVSAVAGRKACAAPGFGGGVQSMLFQVQAYPDASSMGEISIFFNSGGTTPPGSGVALTLSKTTPTDPRLFLNARISVNGGLVYTQVIEVTAVYAPGEFMEISMIKIFGGHDVMFRYAGIDFFGTRFMPDHTWLAEVPYGVAAFSGIGAPQPNNYEWDNLFFVT